MSREDGRGSQVGDRGSRIGDWDLDAAIDRAVREMLDVEAPADLRGRVLDRIDALSTSAVFGTSPVVSGFNRKLWWLAGPVAAAAVVVLAVFAPWRQTAPHVEPSVSPPIAAVNPVPVPAPPTSHSPQPRTAPRSGSPVTTVALPGPRPLPRGIEDRLVVAAVAVDADHSTVIDPLAPLAPIAVAGTHPVDIAQKDIAISPLAPLAELQIAPLSPPDRRN